ncbi:hypothetical protein [Pseudarthrobacter sp. PS3-L1]|uniref:hypothetical protein n=1 Tax=Pseudarthrobacter sp. PS3-L1 TaxID=3046207 RepID=UPI0024BA67C9|nr:hypothetical protein [Pseudarthrobacter sp. PS3-L1]MDJ0321933.1 hypothetical protein [Pseudarthrobacter sp. PS3-L1]
MAEKQRSVVRFMSTTDRLRAIFGPGPGLGIPRLHGLAGTALQRTMLMSWLASLSMSCADAD